MKPLALFACFALTASAQTVLIPPVRYEAPSTAHGYPMYPVANLPVPAKPPICSLLLCAQYADGTWYIPEPEQAAYCTEVGRVRRLGYHDWRCGADHRWRKVK